MSYPTKLHLFRKWAKAMEEGATVDRPDYGKKGRTTRTGSSLKHPHRMRRRHRRRAKKTQD